MHTNEKHIGSEKTADFIAFVRDYLKSDESRALFEKILAKAQAGSDPAYTENFLIWLHEGSTIRLRDELCLQFKEIFAYLDSDFRQNNTWFNAFSEIDTAGYKRKWWLAEDRLAVRSFLTVTFSRNVDIDLARLGKKAVSEVENRHLARLIYEDYSLRQEFDGCYVANVTALDKTLLVEAQLAFTKGIYADNVDFFEFMLRRPGIDGAINGSFKIHGLRVDGIDYPIDNSGASYDRYLEEYKIRKITEEKTPLLENWAQALVANRFMSTKQIEDRVDLLLATTEPVFSSADADETAGKRRPLKETRFEGIASVIDPSLVAMVKQKSPNGELKVKETVAELKALKTALHIINNVVPTIAMQVAPSIQDISSAYARGNRSATVTPAALAALLDEHAPGSEAGDAFRDGLLVASQLALEVQEGQGGTAKIRDLHEQMQSEIEERQTMSRRP